MALNTSSKTLSVNADASNKTPQSPYQSPTRPSNTQAPRPQGPKRPNPNYNFGYPMYQTMPYPFMQPPFLPYHQPFPFPYPPYYPNQFDAQKNLNFQPVQRTEGWSNKEQTKVPPNSAMNLITAEELIAQARLEDEENPQ